MHSSRQSRRNRDCTGTVLGNMSKQETVNWLGMCILCCTNNMNLSHSQDRHWYQDNICCCNTLYRMLARCFQMLQNNT